MILMAVGPWVFVITLIVGLGKLDMSMSKISQETAQDATQYTGKILSIGSDKQITTEESEADVKLRSAA